MLITTTRGRGCGFVGVHSMMIDEFADRYCTSVGGSAGYREQLRVLTKRLPWQVEDLTPSKINGYLATALRQLAPSTVCNHRRMLMTLMRAAQRDGLAENHTQTIDRVKQNSPLIRAWTLDELRLLVETAKKMRGKTVKYPCDYSVLMPAWVLVGYSSGLRRGDLLRIRWDEMRGNRLAIVMSKTGKQHVSVLDEAAMEALEKIPRYDRIIFGTIVSKDQIRKVMRRLIDAAGLEGSGKWLRRSSATYAELSGISASLQLGHQTPGMAYRHYVDQVIVSELRRPVPSIPLAAVG